MIHLRHIIWYHRRWLRHFPELLAEGVFRGRLKTDTLLHFKTHRPTKFVLTLAAGVIEASSLFWTLPSGSNVGSVHVQTCGHPTADHGRNCPFEASVSATPGRRWARLHLPAIPNADIFGTMPTTFISQPSDIGTLKGKSPEQFSSRSRVPILF